MYQCAVIKVTVMSIEKNCLVVDRVVVVYVAELGHGFKAPVYIFEIN